MRSIDYPFFKIVVMFGVAPGIAGIIFVIITSAKRIILYLK